MLSDVSKLTHEQIGEMYGVSADVARVWVREARIASGEAFASRAAIAARLEAKFVEQLLDDAHFVTEGGIIKRANALIAAARLMREWAGSEPKSREIPDRPELLERIRALAPAQVH